MIRYIFLGTLIFFSSNAIPPVLINKYNSCWNNTALQLLFNMPEITKQLVHENIEKKVKNSPFLYAYVDFLQLAFKGVEREFFTANLAHRKAQKIRDIPKKNFPELIAESISGGRQADPIDFITALFEEMEKYGVDLYEKHCKVVYEKGTFGFKNVSLNVGSKRTGKVVKMPNYFIYFIDEPNIKAQKNIKVDETISNDIWATIAPLKTKIGGSLYDLISLAVHSGGSDEVGHYTAYILDQFASSANQLWYKCDDIAVLKGDTKDPQNIYKYWNKVQPLPIDDKNQQYLPKWSSQLRPRIAIYKKITPKLEQDAKTVDTFAHALQDIEKN